MNNFDEAFAEIESQVPQNKVVNFFADIAKIPHRPLVLYGAGGMCEFAMFTCSLMGISVDHVCDSKATGIYTYKKSSSYEIISPVQLIRDHSDAYVSITTWTYEKEIMKFLTKSGFPSNQIYYFRSPSQLTLETFRTQYLDDYRWAYKFFADSNSKQKILDRIKHYFWGVPVPLNSLYVDGYFAYPGICLTDNEVYIDGGAYTGDTVEEFLNAVKGNYSHIYSFEPDPKNYETLCVNLSQYDHIDVIQYGLWSVKTQLNLRVTGGAEHVGSGLTLYESQRDTITVPVTSLDAFFEDKPERSWPTLIKMDVEGAEKEALIGGTEIIRNKKPQMVICVYHKPEDIYELPQTILNIRNDYKLSLWQIGESFWDLIMYAV